MSELLDKNARTVSEHIGNVFKEGELDESSVVRNFRITAADGLFTEPNGTVGGTLPSLVEAQTAIAELNQNLIGRGEASALFGPVREAGLDRPAVAKTVVTA